MNGSKQLDPECPWAGPEHDEQCFNPYCEPAIFIDTGDDTA